MLGRYKLRRVARSSTVKPRPLLSTRRNFTTNRDIAAHSTKLDALQSRLSTFNDSKQTADKAWQMPKRTDLRVLIVGNDPPALTAALAFSKYGIKPTVLDTSPNVFDPSVEYGVILPMNAMRVFKVLGVDSVISKLGYPVTAFTRTAEFGLPYGGIPYNELAYIHGVPTIGIHYLTLQGALERLTLDMGIEIRRRAQVKSIIQSEPKQRVASLQEIEKSAYANVTYTAMPNIMSNITQFDEQYDVVLISDGAFSKTRELVWPGKTKIAPVGVRFDAIVDRPATVPIGLAVDTWGLMKRCGFFPVTESKIYTYGYVRILEPEEVPRQSTLTADAFNSHFHGTRGLWMDVEKAIANKGWCTRTFVWRSFPEEWVKNRVVLLGSSAHCIPEPAARGHNMAQGLEEALILAKLLSQKYLPIDACLSKYATRPPVAHKIYMNVVQELNLSLSKMGPVRRGLLSVMGRLFLHSQYKLTREENSWVGFDGKRAEELSTVKQPQTTTAQRA